MTNRETSPTVTNPDQISTAIEKYTILLKFYEITPPARINAENAVQQALIDDPETMIADINKYWENVFGSDGAGSEDCLEISKPSSDGQPKPEIDPETGLSGLSRAERTIYEKQRRHWKDNLEKRRGRKARKKNRK